jgi:hypothetical protein
MMTSVADALFQFAQTGVIEAEGLLGTMEQMLLSAGEFLGGLYEGLVVACGALPRLIR